MSLNVEYEYSMLFSSSSNKPYAEYIKELEQLAKYRVLNKEIKVTDDGYRYCKYLFADGSYIIG